MALERVHRARSFALCRLISAVAESLNRWYENVSVLEQ